MTRVAAGVAIGAVLVSSACRRESVARSFDRRGAEVHDSGPGVVLGRLPEDPVAGKQSEIQWRAHMAAEERERQLGYDKHKLEEHQAVVKLLRAARSRYDRATTETAVAKARSRMPVLIEDLRNRITAIDRWGVNSRLLGDYDALIVALSDAYPEARIAALKGDARALEALRGDWDRRTKKVSDWLHDAAISEDE